MKKAILCFLLLILLVIPACTKPQVKLTHREKEDVVEVAVKNLEGKRINTLIEIEALTTFDRKVKDVQKVTVGPNHIRGIIFDFSQKKYHLLKEGEHLKSYEVKHFPIWMVFFKR